MKSRTSATSRQTTSHMRISASNSHRSFTKSTRPSRYLKPSVTQKHPELSDVISPDSSAERMSGCLWREHDHSFFCTELFHTSFTGDSLFKVSLPFFKEVALFGFCDSAWPLCCQFLTSPHPVAPFPRVTLFQTKSDRKRLSPLPNQHDLVPTICDTDKKVSLNNKLRHCRCEFHTAFRKMFIGHT